MKKLNFAAGEIPDKERRGFIHNAIRLAFPLLKTKVTRTETVSKENNQYSFHTISQCMNCIRVLTCKI